MRPSRIQFFKMIDRTMKDTALYEHLLGLTTPWSVKKVDLSLAGQRVVVEVVLKKGRPRPGVHVRHPDGWPCRSR